MKLQIKVTLLVLAILLVIGGISSGIMVYSIRRATENQFYDTADTVTQAVRGCLELFMLSGDNHYVQDEITTIAQKDQVNSIVLALPDGSISASSDPSQIGRTIEDDWFPPTLPAADATVFLGGQENRYEFLTVSPVLNSAQCQDCHTPDTAVLGLILVDLNTFQMDKHLREETLLIATLGGLTFVFLGAGLAFLLRRTILKPLSLLSGSAQRIARGEYFVRVKNHQDDEIGTLARSFNEMAANVEQREHALEESRQETAALNVGLEERIRQRTQDISSLNAVLTIINQSSGEEKLVRDALAGIIGETGLAAGMIHMIDGKSGELVCVSQQGLSAGSAARMAQLGIGEFTPGQAFLSKEVIVADDGGHSGGLAEIAGEKGRLQSCISLPIKSDGHTLGILTLASFKPGRFDAETVRLLSTISEAICIAIEKTRANFSIQEANKIQEQLLERLISAQEEERRRIARELHDAASQSLAALALNLDTIAGDLPAKYDNVRTRLTSLKEQTIDTMGDIRDLALELRPSILDDLGLARAIKSYARDYLGKRGISVNVNVISSEVKLPPYYETMLFRIAQEALTNIVKHAEAMHVTVQLSLTAAGAIMRVEDNGRGFDLEAKLQTTNLRQSLGLYSMSERAALLGGTFRIKSEVGRGTFISVEVPLADVKTAHGTG